MYSSFTYSEIPYFLCIKDKYILFFMYNEIPPFTEAAQVVLWLS